jgi:hypothetical protein
LFPNTPRRYVIESKIENQEKYKNIGKKLKSIENKEKYDNIEKKLKTKMRIKRCMALQVRN